MSALPSILVCDDEPELASELGEFFEASQWSVIVSVSAAAARSLLAGGFAPTCLLTDLRLGDGTGSDLIAFARALPAQRRPGVIALITGHCAEPDGTNSHGADLCYHKPVDPFRIIADIEHLVAERGSEPAGTPADPRGGPSQFRENADLLRPDTVLARMQLRDGAGTAPRVQESSG